MERVSCFSQIFKIGVYGWGWVESRWGTGFRTDDRTDNSDRKRALTFSAGRRVSESASGADSGLFSGKAAPPTVAVTRFKG